MSANAATIAWDRESGEERGRAPAIVKQAKESGHDSQSSSLWRGRRGPCRLCSPAASRRATPAMASWLCRRLLRRLRLALWRRLLRRRLLWRGILRRRIRLRRIRLAAMATLMAMASSPAAATTTAAYGAVFTAAAFMAAGGGGLTNSSSGSPVRGPCAGALPSHPLRRSQERSCRANIRSFCTISINRRSRRRFGSSSASSGFPGARSAFRASCRSPT